MVTNVEGKAIRLITDCLDVTASEYPTKLSFVDEKRGLSFSHFRQEALCVASSLISELFFKKPIAVFLEQSVESVVSFFGIAYSGNFYTVIDPAMPIQRIKKIIATLEPVAIITSEKYKEIVSDFSDNARIFIYSEMMRNFIDEDVVYRTVEKIVDTDLIYVLFTSGSTGVPKGVAISHRSLVNFTEWTTSAFNINSNDVMGNQAPFFFDFSLTDIYGTVRSGATLYIIPRQYFIFPVKVLQFIKEKKINTISFVPTVLCNIANLDLLSECDVSCLKKIIFAGEVMPTKQLNYWRNKIPNALYGNHYGPTEGTGFCTYYIANRDFSDTDSFPIGYPCCNTDVLVLNDNDELVSGQEQGELCIRGISLSYGYYKNPEKTALSFVQNPLNKCYPEKIYRTGDLVHYNKYGELVFDGRKDSQIKLNGHRIELGEVEVAASSVKKLNRCAALFNKTSNHIVLFYESDSEIDVKEIISFMNKELPKYMIPQKFIWKKELPTNMNGKIDRNLLKEIMEE